MTLQMYVCISVNWSNCEDGIKMKELLNTVKCITSIVRL